MRPPAAPRQPRREPGAGSAASPASAPENPSSRPRRASQHPEQAAARPDRAAGRRAVPAPRTLAEPTDGADEVQGRRWALVRRRPDMAAVAGAGRGFLDRLEERTRARRRLTWHKILIVAGVLVILGAAAWLVLVSSVLALDLEDVTVTGVGEGSTVSRGEVMAVVEPAAGTPLARLDTGALAEGVDVITTVAGVQVTRSWPTGLVVDVVARVPVAAGTTEDGTVLLDAEGVVVGTADEVPEEMPLVTVPLDSDRAGQTLGAVLTVLAELPPELRADVASAGATNPASVTLELTDGAQVRWGSVAESELKAAVLEMLREREAGVYDLTVPRSPTLSE